MNRRPRRSNVGAALAWSVLLIGMLTASVRRADAVGLDLVVSGLPQPVFVTSARDGTGRLFIVEQGGLIKVLQPGSSTPTVFLDLSSRVRCCGERGLLGLAFHPSVGSNRRFFVSYTRASDGSSIIAEFQASPINPNLAADR